jgi:hypothetical protein
MDQFSGAEVRVMGVWLKFDERNVVMVVTV